MGMTTCCKIVSANTAEYRIQNSGVKHALCLSNRQIVVYLTFLEICCIYPQIICKFKINPGKTSSPDNSCGDSNISIGLPIREIST